MRRPLWRLVLLPLAAGCALISSPGDRHFQAGDLRRAANAYGALVESGAPGSERTARALYRLALIHSVASGPAHDPARAAALLERLQAQHGGSRYAAEGGILLGMLREAEELRLRLAERRGEIERLDAELAAARLETQRVEGEALGRKEHLDRLARQIDQLKTRMGELAEDLARRQQELEQLKAIDLGTPP